MNLPEDSVSLLEKLISQTAPEDDPSSIVDVDSIEAINKSTWSEKWAEYRKRPGSFIMFIFVHLATLITVLSIGFLLVYVLVKGIPNLNADIFRDRKSVV